MKKNIKVRRQGVLERLEQQLKDGTKKVEYENVPLTDKDVKRIKKEIQILKEREKHEYT